MQTERIAVRSPCMSGPARLWEALCWCSGGQQRPARTFVPQHGWDRKSPLRKSLISTLNGSFLQCFRRCEVKVEGPEGCLKHPPPCPTFTLSLPNVSIPVLLDPPSLPFFSLLVSLSSPVPALLCRLFCFHALSFLKRAPRPSEFQRVTQTIHCLTSTSTSTSCLGGLGGGPVLGPQGRWVQSAEAG